MKSRTIWALATLFLISQPSGCMTWRPTAGEPASYIAEHAPRVVRVVRADGTHLVIEAPGLSGDSITTGGGTLLCGSEGPTGRPGVCVMELEASSMPVPVVALSEVSGLEVRRTDPARTIGLVLAIPVGLLAVLVAADCVSADSYFC